MNELLENIEYLATTTQEIVKIPKTITPDILYITGVIMGDGSLPINHRYKENNFQYTVSITSKGKEFLEGKIKPILQQTFEIEKISIFYRNRRWPSWSLEKGNKIIYRFFMQTMEIPTGKKGQKAKIPDIIKKLEPVHGIPFLAGLIDSDIGKHGKGMGCTFRSKAIVNDLIEFLGKLGITAKSYGTHFKNNKYIQHDFSIPKSQVKKLKDVLEQNYLPKREDRLNTLFSRAGVR